MTYARKIRNFYFWAPENFNFWGKRRARRSALQVQSTQSHEPLLKRMFYFSGTKNPLHFLLAQGMKMSGVFFLLLLVQAHFYDERA